MLVSAYKPTPGCKDPIFRAVFFIFRTKLFLFTLRSDALECLNTVVTVSLEADKSK